MLQRSCLHLAGPNPVLYRSSWAITRALPQVGLATLAKASFTERSLGGVVSQCRFRILLKHPYVSEASATRSLFHRMTMPCVRPDYFPLSATSGQSESTMLLRLFACVATDVACNPRSMCTSEEPAGGHGLILECKKSSDGTLQQHLAMHHFLLERKLHCTPESSCGCEIVASKKRRAKKRHASRAYPESRRCYHIPRS